MQEVEPEVADPQKCREDIGIKTALCLLCISHGLQHLNRTCRSSNRLAEF